MAMTIRVFGEKVSYVPEWGGNRASADPTVFELKPMTASEFRAHAIAHANAAGNAQQAFDAIDETLKKHVLGCGSLCLEVVGGDAGDALAPCSVAELLAVGPRDLLLELYQAITDASKLSEGLAKKSNSPLVS